MNNPLLKKTWMMLVASFFAITSMAQVTTVTVTEAGTLWETLDAQGIDISTVTELKVIGPINNSDFRFMRSFLPALVSADLADSEFDEVPGEAFRENTHLRTLRLPANITRISDLAFYHCDALESVAFGQMDFEVGKVVFPASLTSMGGGAFEHCVKLQTVDLSACTDLGIEGFYQCSKLTEIILPATGNIGFGANCFLETNIEKLTLTPAVTWLEYNSLPYSLKILIVESKTPYNCSVNAFDSVNKSSLQIWVPQGTIKKYSLADGWYNVNNLIREYNVKVNIQGEGSLFDGMTALNTGSVFLHGDQTTLTAQPTEGYTLQSATLAGQMLAINDNTITLPNPAVEGTLTVVFAPNVYTLTIEVTGNGTILRDGVAVGSTLIMAHGESTTFTLNPADGLSVQSVEFNGEESVLQNGGQTYTTPAMTGDATLHVIFGNNDIQNTVQMTVVTGDGGTVIYKGVTLEPTSVFRVKKSEVATFTFAPVKGMRIDKVLLNDTDLTDQVSNLQFSISNLTDDAQMEVTFISASNIVVNNPNGGELNDLILAQGGNAKQVTTLKITGTLNARDWTVIQNLMTALEEIDLSETNLTSIPESAFANKATLKKVILPTSVTRICHHAFGWCGSLQVIEGCENVKEIEDSAFGDCFQLQNFPFGDKITHFETWHALANCTSLPNSIVMPASLIYLGGNAFLGSSVRSFDLSNCFHLEVIEPNAVGNATSVILPESGSYRFGYEALKSSQLTELVLPASVNRLDNNVMPSTLQRLYVKATTPIDCDQSAFDDVNFDDCILYVPTGSTADYQLASGWFKFDNVEEFGFACSISGKGVVKMGESTYSDKEVFFPVVGAATTFQIVPDVGYEISSVKFNNQAISLTDNNTYTIGASVIKGRLEVQFVQKQLTATLEIAGAGSVTIDGQTYTSTTSLPVAGGSVLDMVLTPNEGNFVKQILLNGEDVIFKNGGLAYSTPEITENSQIKVVFASNSELANMATVTVGMVGFGTIRYKGLPLDDGDTFLLNKGDDLTLEVLAEDDADAQLTSFLVNDVDVTEQVVNNTYTMTNVTNDIAIEATFFSVTHLIVNNPNGGELNDQILAQGGNARKLTSLKVNGTLNARDWTIIQNFMTALEEIDLSGTNLTSMPENAFNGKGLLKMVKLPSTVTIINGGAFANCSTLITIEGCENVKEIGGDAFANCSQLKNFPFGDKLTHLHGWNPLGGCESLPKEAFMPASLLYLGPGALNYGGIESVDLSTCSTLEVIEHSSVGNASKVILPENGSFRLGGESLRWAQFTEFVLPASVNRLDNNVMPSTLQRLYVKATTPIDCDQSAFDDVHLDECVLYVPTGSSADYQLASGWLKFDNVEEFGFACSINGKGVVKMGEGTYSDKEIFFPIVGTATTFQIVPDVGYEISSVKFNNQAISLTDDNTYTIGASVIKGRLEVQFVQKQLTATLEIAGAGSVTIDGQTYTSTTSLPVVGGSVLEMVLTPDDGNFVKQILLNGEEVVFKNGGLAYTTPKITDDSQIKVVFAPNSELANMAKATMSMDRYGTVRYKGLSLQDGDTFMFNKGEDLTLEILPEGDAQLTSFLVNDVDVTAQVVNNIYTMANVTNDITIDVRFFSVSHLIVDNPNGGELNDLILAQGGNVRKLASLKVNGTLNTRDWTIIQNLMTALEEIDFSETNLTSIPENAFNSKGLLRFVKLPTTVTIINGGAFANCNALTSIEGCENVKEIGGCAFVNCSQLKNFPFGDKLTHLHWDNPLAGCNSLPKNVVMPASLQYLGYGALNYSDIESVDLSQCVNLEAIDNHGVGSANTVILPEKGSFRLGDEAFRSTRLAEVTLPRSVNALGNSVMPSTLRRLYVCSSEPVGAGGDAFSDVNLDECELYVPIGSSADYQLASGWFNFNNVEEFGFACSINGNGVVKMGESTYSDKEIFFPVVGAATTFQIVPDVGYEISSVKFNNQVISLTDDNTYTIGASVIKGRLEVQFVQKQLTATLEIAGAGSVTIDGQTYTSTTSLPVAGGSVLDMALTPNDGNFVKQILLNGEDVTFKNGGLAYTTPEITENSQIKVVFAPNSELANMAKVTISMTGYGGILYKDLSLQDGDTFLLSKGDDLTLEVLLEGDAQLTSFFVNDVNVTAQVVNNTYTMTNVTNDIAIEAIFFSVTHLVVDNPNGGELNDQILAQGSKANRVTSLKVNGTLNAKDWNVINSLMTALREIDLTGTDLTSIPANAFRDKNLLRLVKLPMTVTVIEDESFAECGALTTIEGCDNVKEIKNGAFRNCSKLQIFPFGDKITHFHGNNVFENCASLPKNVVLPISVQYLGAGALNYPGIESVDLSACTSLEVMEWCSVGEASQVILPEGSYRLGVQAFRVARFADLILPANINRIDYDVMPETLQHLYVKATTPIDCDPNAFEAVNFNVCTLYVPTGSSADYQAAAGWDKFTNVEEFGLRVKIGNEGKVKLEDRVMIGDDNVFLKNGETATFQIIPQEGWHTSEVKLNNTIIPVENDQFTITGEQATGLLTISFAINTFDFAVQIIGDGQILLGEDVITNGQVIQADYASVLTFTLQPAADMVVANITLNGEETVVQNGGTTYVTPAITRASALQVTFAESGEMGDFVSYSITTGENGTIEYKNTTLLPETSISVPKGQDAVFILKPNPYYIVQSVTMNGSDITDQVVDNTLTIQNVSVSAQIEVTFAVEMEITIEMENAGLMARMLNNETKQNVTSLTVTGPINENDFYCMRDEMPRLSVLDLWNADCTWIPDGAFCSSYEGDNAPGKTSLTRVRLPQHINSIGYHAFAGCTSLTDVNFTECEELSNISGWAFANTALRDVNLSNTQITELTDCQFRRARKLETLLLPMTMTQLGNAFQECAALVEVDLSGCTRLTNIGDAFSNSKKLVKAVLPEGLESLNYTFSDCNALTIVNFPKSLEVIGDMAFYNTMIKSADLRPLTKLKRIGSSAFNHCLDLADLTLPDGLERLGGWAFHECKALKAVDLSKMQLTIIENSAFCWCDNLESVKLPKTLVTIDENAFRGSKLSGILELPSTLSEIRPWAFEGAQIALVKIGATTPPTLGEGALSASVAAAFVPFGYAEVYRDAPYWEDLTILDKEVQGEVTVTREGNLAIDIMEQVGVAPGLITHLKVHGPLNSTDFGVLRSNMTLLYDLDMEDADISMIPDNAFLEKKILMNVKLPNSLLVIQEGAFRGCSSLSGVLTLPSGVTTIGNSAFQGCTSLNGIVINDALEVIRSYAFEGCGNLTQEITFPDNFMSLGEYAFANCHKLFGKVKFNPEFYMFIGSEGYWSSTGRAFENCNRIEEVDLSECEYLYEIPSATFNECSSLTTVKLPPYLERIDDHAFMNCRSLRNISFPTSLLVINYNAFNGCSSLRSIDLSNCKEFGTIEGWAFSGCSSLETVNLPKSLNWIRDYAFNECRKLANLNVEALQPADLGEYVFRRVNTGKCVLSIPTGVYYDYLTAAQWGAFVQMRNAIDVTLDEGANLSYTNNANVNADDTPNHAPRRNLRKAAPGVAQTGEANVKDGTSLYISDDESVTFYINPEENVSIKQVLFNGEDVTDMLNGNAFETPKVTEASSFKVLLNIDGPITVKELRMIETSLAIKVAESHQIIATIYPNNATNKNIIWTSSDETVAKVLSDGTVTGLKAGRTTITARTEDGDFTQSCEVVIMSNDYYVTLTDQETFVQNEARIPLALHNTDDASGIQFDVYMPDGVTLNPDAVQISGRSNGHTITAANCSDGSVRVIVYSNEGLAFTEHDGELVTLPFTTLESTGEYEVAVRNIHISGPNNFDFVAPDYTARISIADYPLGDSNGNGNVTVTDVANTVDHLLERYPERFIQKAADVNQDGIISVSDITATIDIILERTSDSPTGSHGRRAAAQSLTDKLFIEDFNISAGQQMDVELKLENAECYTAFQCDLQLPEGISIIQDNQANPIVTFTDSQENGHVLSAKSISDNTLRFVVYSMQNKAFADSNDGVIKLTLTAADGITPGLADITLTNARLVNVDNRKEFSAPDTQTLVSITEPTGINTISAEGLQIAVDGRILIIDSTKDMTTNLISIDGKTQLLRIHSGKNRINVENSGIYVICGKKLIIK